MSAKDVRTLIDASPFRPFSIVTTDDVLIRVSEPSAARMSTEGNLHVYSAFDESFKAISADAIKEIVVDRVASPQAIEQLDRIRRYRKARPFTPFTVALEDGRTFYIDWPLHIAIPPGDRKICISTEPNGIAQIPVAELREVKLG